MCNARHALSNVKTKRERRGERRRKERDGEGETDRGILRLCEKKRKVLDD
jgi:hypothetical protein